MTKMNDSYVAGYLETNGGFFIQYKKYLRFKISTSNKKVILPIIEYLTKQYGVIFKEYSKAYYLTNLENIEWIIDFMEKNCIRTDYKKFLSNLSVLNKRKIWKKNCDMQQKYNSNKS